MALADDLAAYAHDLSYGDLDEETIEAAKRRILDAVACAYAAMDEEPVQAVTRFASRKQGDRTATILGTDTTCAVEDAALATGALIRYLDWNDTYLAKEPSHPSDNLGAILPVAEAYDRSGKDMILATVLAYELQCRLCDAASLRANGFDHVNYGLVSATLATGTLMDLSKEQLVQAVNIAVNGHVALRQARAGELSAWKGFAFANVARNAIVSCQLAAEGVNGPAPIFEGQFGFFNQVSGEFSLDTQAFGGNDGTFKINETYIKYYPVEYHAQAAVHLALQVKEEHGIDWQDIERIENETYEAAVSIIGEEDEKWRPETRETADHSMPYCIARAFMDGAMTLNQFSPDKVTDRDVYAFMERISIEENSEFTARYGDAFPHRMRVVTENKTYEEELRYPKGHPENPLTLNELQEKFETAADGTAADRQEEIVRQIQALEDQSSITGLF